MEEKEEKQEKQDKPENKVESPPKMIDPQLAKTVEFAEKAKKKKTHRFERE